MFKRYLEKPLLGFSALRSLNYLIQMRSLYTISSLLPIFKQLPKQDKTKEKEILEDLYNFIKSDVKNITDGVYPVEVLKPESIVTHFLRIPKLIIDGININLRRDKHKTKDFDKKAKEYLDEVPEYYRRNFHFQTDGYLSEQSAELYDHQVELLFAGAADAMRRLILKPMKEANPAPQKILELGCGTGSATRFIAQTFPDAKVTALDLSYPYLKIAKRRLKNFSRIDFLQADAAELPFKDQQFDAVVSIFLFHELPLEIRKKVLAESKRVLKPGGFIGFVDSLQKGDRPTYDDVLKKFPVDFHEPFYKSYIETPMESLIHEAGLKPYHQDSGFLSKVAWSAT